MTLPATSSLPVEAFTYNQLRAAGYRSAYLYTKTGARRNAVVLIPSDQGSVFNKLDTVDLIDIRALALTEGRLSGIKRKDSKSNLWVDLVHFHVTEGGHFLQARRVPRPAVEKTEKTISTKIRRWAKEATEVAEKDAAERAETVIVTVYATNGVSVVTR